MKNARQLALEMLSKIEKEKSYSNIIIAGALKSSGLQNADKALFTALVYGVTERKITLDYNLSLYLNQPLKKLKPQVLCILRIGAYQILFMDKIPSRAAINESVNLTKKKGLSFASGLVNAVLRKVAENGLKLPDTENKVEYLSIKYSCPKDLVSHYISSYGEENAIGIMEYSNGPQPISIRVNTVATTTKELAQKLKDRSIETVENDLVEDALTIVNSSVGAIEELPEYTEGLFHVQDISSQICCKRLDPQPGDIVLDVCAAPGGKSFTVAERMENKGTVCSFDMYEHRVGLISFGAERLGLTCIKAGLQDASSSSDNYKLADRILCDVPCSGLGIIGRKPEIRYKALENIDNLPKLQYDILTNVSKYLKEKGVIVYSTCALNPRENEQVVNKFLEENPSFELISMETIMPHEYHCDGFFIAKMTCNA